MSPNPPIIRFNLSKLFSFSNLEETLAGISNQMVRLVSPLVLLPSLLHHNNTQHATHRDRDRDRDTETQRHRDKTQVSRKICTSFG